MTFVRFETQEEFYDHAAEQFARIGAAAIRDRGRFLVALSGGKTPRPLLERLALPAYAERVDWPAAHIFWADERCVAPTDERSNVRMAREVLLDRVPIPSDRIHRIEGEGRPIDAADAYEVLLHRVLGDDGRLDLILLGIGADGHTASLFPGHQALTETDRWIVPVHVSADPPWRVTMTLPLLNAARHILFLVLGKTKAAAIRDLQEGEPLPASLVRPADGTLTVLVDDEAASLLGE
jgi:6-phosphogluconolactonase